MRPCVPAAFRFSPMLVVQHLLRQTCMPWARFVTGAIVPMEGRGNEKSSSRFGVTALCD